MVIRELAELGNSPYRTQPMQVAVIYGNAGRIITSIFKTTKSLQKSGNDVTAGYRADYAAHAWLPFLTQRCNENDRKTESFK
jgi:hypothetical protein